MSFNGKVEPRITLDVLGPDRKSCDCWKCRAACKHMPGYLIPHDLVRIVKRFGVEESVKLLRPSNGALVYSKNTGRTFRIPTIVPDTDSTGRCVFFTKDQRCSIHGIAPFGCAAFNVCEPLTHEAAELSKHGLMAVHQHEKYLDFWSFLATHKAPTEPAKGREKLNEALMKGEHDESQE